MKCRKCKNRLQRGDKFCTRCGKKVKTSFSKIIRIVLPAVILMGITVFAAWKWKSSDLETGTFQENDKFVFIADSFTERKIVDQDSARRAVQDAANVLGIQDAENELKECLENEAFGNTYYRFYQEYHGIPVYGRNVVIGADSDGNALGLSGNYLNMENLKIDCTADETAALDAASAVYGDRISICSEGLVIYSLYDVEAVPAWKILVIAEDAMEYCFVSARSGEIIAVNSLVYTDTADGYGTDTEGNMRIFNTEKTGDDVYALKDEEKNIVVYDANGETLVREIVIVDEEGKIYSYDNEKWRDSEGTEVIVEDYINHSGQLICTIYNQFGNIIGENGFYDLVLKTKKIKNSRNEVVFQYIDPKVNKSIEWNDKKAVSVMANISDVYDFYQYFLGREGFNGQQGLMKVVYNDYIDGDVTNAYSAYGASSYFTLLSFGRDAGLTYDLLGHEYTHSVEQSISGMQYQGESGALMEAYSDIFGEIVEDWGDDRMLTDDCDWIHGKEGRTFSNPSSYQDENWINTDLDYDNGGVHTNSTVISHAAYLMWNGIDGGSVLERLNTEELAELFYSSLFFLMPDCTFGEFRTLVQNQANIMYKQGKLSYSQVRCVSNAFFQVGISAASMYYRISEDCDLYVYDVNQELSDNYTISVVTKEKLHTGAILPDTYGEVVKDTVDEASPYKLCLDEGGIYQIKIADGTDSDDIYSFFVEVVDGKDDSLKIYTDFGNYGAETNGYNRYIQAVQTLTASGSWSENLSMTAATEIADDSGRQKATVRAGTYADISGYRADDSSEMCIDGSGWFQVLNTKYAWEVTYSDGSAHYQYTEPYAQTVDMEMKPDFFDFGSLTRDRMTDLKTDGNKITFRIKGEDMSEMGIAAINLISETGTASANLMSGVEGLSYKDAYVEVTIDESTGKIDMMHMVFHASLNYQGYHAETDYDMEYTFSD